LISDEIAHRALGGDASVGPRPLRGARRSDQSLGDESVQGTRAIEWDESGYRFAVVGDGHLVPVANDLEVSAEVIS
jgi:hypothetical protein